MSSIQDLFGGRRRLLAIIFFIYLLLTASYYLINSPTFLSAEDTKPNTVVLANPEQDNVTPVSNGPMGFDHIYVINLPHRDDRRIRMKAIADYLGVTFTFVDGVYTNDTEVEMYTEKYGANSTAPQVACWRSHMNVYDVMIKNDDQSALILEDDIDAEANIERRVNEMRPHLPKDWDAWFLGHCHGKEWRGKVLGHPNLHVAVQPQCTHAYAVSRKGARKFLNVLAEIDRAIDKTIRNKYREGQLKIFSVQPPITGQLRMRGNPSDVNPGALALKGSGQALLEDSVYMRLLKEGLYKPDDA
ncbi:glycosyltransferase family 25-domain-containing protein [Jimgerdemannia flammicorona]|uniref:Glycosyltransferase family 25-domain-containing protein n=1 Tax=Jimgerdemannia flammicorona TaxID=994334 RepID=A0A433QC44_9FUNG|nr:glycosyltransferase family 25-domain-containing protein [Jimgerdemannia flammicorona]